GALDSAGTLVTVTYANPVTAGHLLVAAVRTGNRAATASVTDNDGNAWQLVDRRVDAGGGGGDDLELWYAPNALASPNNRPTLSVSSTMSASLRVVIAEYSGI